jgi:hypothetical protein
MLHLFSLDRSVPSAGSIEGRVDFSGRVESNCRAEAGRDGIPRQNLRNLVASIASL